jgi:hypothetical protein
MRTSRSSSQAAAGDPLRRQPPCDCADQRPHVEDCTCRLCHDETSAGPGGAALRRPPRWADGRMRERPEGSRGTQTGGGVEDRPPPDWWDVLRLEADEEVRLGLTQEEG